MIHFYAMRPYLLHKRGSVWYFRCAGERTFHSTGETAKDRAERWVLRHLSRPASAVKPITLRSLSEDLFVWGRCPWIRAQLAMKRPISQATAKMRRGHLVNHIWKRWGDAPLDQATPRAIRDWLVGLKLSGQTRNHLRYTLSIVYEQAVLDEILAGNPMDRVPAFGDDSKHHDAFTAAELRKLFPFDARKLVRIWGEPRWAAMH